MEINKDNKKKTKEKEEKKKKSILPKKADRKRHDTATMETLTKEEELLEKEICMFLFFHNLTKRFHKAATVIPRRNTIVDEKGIKEKSKKSVINRFFNRKKSKENDLIHQETTPVVNTNKLEEPVIIQSPEKPPETKKIEVPTPLPINGNEEIKSDDEESEDVRSIDISKDDDKEEISNEVKPSTSEPILTEPSEKLPRSHSQEAKVNPKSPRKKSKARPIHHGIKEGPGLSMRAKDRLVSYFFVIGTSGKNLEVVDPKFETGTEPFNRPYKSELLDHFPNSTKDDPFPPHIGMFCFPSGVRFSKTEKSPSCFPFILTSETGSRLYCSTLVFYEEVNSPDTLKELNTTGPIFAPKCIGVLSHWPFYSVFREWLNELYRKVFISKSNVPIENYIVHFICEVPLPPATKQMKIKFHVGDKVLNISRPPKNSFPLLDIPMHYLFKCLSLGNVITLFRCILLEQRILLLSRQLTLLTFSCEIITSLLYPFNWHHVLVPILPELLSEFAFSPTPFIMGAHTDNISSIIDAVKQDVVIVDLDKNTIEVPIATPELPDPQYSQLLFELKQLFQADLLSLDSMQFNPYSTSKKDSETKSMNSYIRCAFLKFFSSLMKDYREFIMYIRVFERPIAVFDTTNFLAKMKPNVKDFFDAFFATQAFALFLEENNWPNNSIFNQWIDQHVYKLSIEDILQKHDPGSTKERFPEILTISEPSISSSPVAVQLFSDSATSSIFFMFPFSNLPDDSGPKIFPALNQKALEVAYSLHPVPIVSKHAPSTPQKRSGKKPELDNSNPSLNPEILLAYYPIRKDIPAAENEYIAESKLCKEITQKFLESIGGQALPSTELNQLIDFFTFEYGRREFAVAISEQVAKAKGDRKLVQLSLEKFPQIVELINALLREANASNDFVHPRIIIPALFAFHKIEHGAEDFVYNRVKKQDIWQNYMFWERALFETIQKLTNELYGNDIRGRMEDWEGFSEATRKKIIFTESDSVFHLLSQFAYHMVNIGVEVDTIRRFMLKICDFATLDDEQTKTLMQLLSNMTRANEQMIIDENRMEEDIGPKKPEIKTARFKKGDRYLSIGVRGSMKTEEGKDLFKIFVKEKTEKGTLKKFRKTFRSVWFNEKKPIQESTSEYRDDYTVKTLKGHTEGVLYVACSPDGTVASGSCDGSIKIWNLLDGTCTSTLSNHKGWVNVLQFTEDSKLISGSYDRTLKLWDVQKGSKIFSMRGHKGCVSCLRVKEKTVISGSYDNILHLWDLRHHKKPVVSFFGHTSPVMCLDLEGHYLVSGSRDTTLRMWDLRTGKSLKTFSGHNDWVKYCKLDGSLLISGSCDSTVRIWNTTANNDCSILEGHTGTVNNLYSDSKTIVSASADCTLKVWDTNFSTCIKTLEGHTDEVLICVPFQTKLASCSYDSTIRIWDVEKGTTLSNLTGHSFRITSMASFESKLITASWDKTVKVWEFPIDWRPS